MRVLIGRYGDRTSQYNSGSDDRFVVPERVILLGPVKRYGDRNPQNGFESDDHSIYLTTKMLRVFRQMPVLRLQNFTGQQLQICVRVYLV